MLDYKYKSYRVIGNNFTYIEMVDGKEQHKSIPLMINGKLNPKTEEIVNEINRINSIIKDMSRKAKTALTPKIEPTKKEEPKKASNEKKPYQELYENLKNPLDNPVVIEKLIENYATSINNLGGFYGRLSESFSGDKKYKNRFFPSSKDNFYATLFNKWKASIIELKKTGRLNPEAESLYQKLSKIPDVKTYEEVRKIVYSDEEIEDYYWDNYYSGWVHTKSHRIDNTAKDKVSNIEHRLYVSPEGVVVHDFALCFINKCIERNIPYYFKFDEACARDDALVIYSDTKHLMDYIDILNEIKKEHPKLVELCKTPPILTGRINDFVGYGSEPTPDEKGNPRSFNDVRSTLLENAFDITVFNWARNNQSTRINYKNRVVTISDWLCHEITNRVYEIHENRFKDYRQKNQLDNYFNYYGLREEDFNTPIFKNRIYKEVKNNFDAFINGQKVDIRITTRNGKSINISSNNFKNTLKDRSKIIFKNVPELKTELRKNIDMEAKKVGIDVNKFCIDDHARKLLEHADQTYHTDRIKTELEKVRAELLGTDYQSPIETGTYII